VAVCGGGKIEVWRKRARSSDFGIGQLVVGERISREPRA